ncbi:hypothetical protein DB345_05270 [Spartobacteria bacterium LR76]|nr:hypothetical protein DB345_05270 [Spartobacteria bacterium LR76]
MVGLGSFEDEFQKSSRACVNERACAISAREDPKASLSLMERFPNQKMEPRCEIGFPNIRTYSYPVQITLGAGLIGKRCLSL